MSLVFAAITPHPPLLIPSIGQAAAAKMAATKTAFEKLEEDLYLSKPSILLVISPHGNLLDEAFTINISAEFQTDLREFGDLSTKLTFKGDLDLASLIRESNKKEHHPLTMISDKKLDHGASVPLFFLTSHIPKILLLPVGPCELDAKAHFDFGILLKEQIMKTNRRVAVLASADLSHALTTDAPAGFQAEGKEFDATLRKLLATKNSAGILQMDWQLVRKSYQCGYRSIAMLLGILRNINYAYEEYAYEAPFGVGYLTANFSI